MITQHEILGVSRPLSPSEYFLWLVDHANSTNHVAIAEVSGEFHQGALQRALRNAQRRHPLLCSRIVARQNKHVVFEPVPDPPPIEASRVPLEGWRERIALELDTSFAPGSYPLMRCLWLSEQEGETVVALVFHHVIADGIAGTSLMHEVLLDAMSPASEDGCLSVKTALPCLEDLYPPLMKGLAQHTHTLRVHAYVCWTYLRRSIAKTLPHFTPIKFQPRDLQIESIELDETTSAALLASCRRENTTIHGALGAAVLEAVHAEFPPSRPRSLSLISPINLRHHLKIPVGPDNMGNYIGLLLTSHRIASDTRFWTLAREFSGELRRCVQRGDAHAQWFKVPPKVLIPPTRFGADFANRVMQLFEPPSVTITNIGRLDTLPRDHGVDIRSLSFMMSPTIRDYLTLCASSWEGRLRINAIFSRSASMPHHSVRILERFQKYLEAHAKSA